MIACRIAGGRAHGSLYRKIVKTLDDISKTTDQTARVAKVRDLWRKTGQLILRNSTALQEATTRLSPASPSLDSREDPSDTSSQWTRHQANLTRIQQFFTSYPEVTGESLVLEGISPSISPTSAEEKCDTVKVAGDREIDSHTRFDSDCTSSETAEQRNVSSLQSITANASLSRDPIRASVHRHDALQLDANSQLL